MLSRGNLDYFLDIVQSFSANRKCFSYTKLNKKKQSVLFIQTGPLIKTYVCYRTAVSIASDQRFARAAAAEQVGEADLQPALDERQAQARVLCQREESQT